MSDLAQRLFAERPRWLGPAGALAVLFAVLMVVYVLAVQPVLSAYERTRGELVETERLLARYQAVAADSEALDRLAEELQAHQAASGVFLSGATGALAAAALQNRIAAAVEQAGGSVRSMQTTAPQQVDGLSEVGVRVQFTGTIRTVEHLLYELESSQPLLFIRELSLRGRLERMGGGEEVAMHPELLVEMAVLGYHREVTS